MNKKGKRYGKKMKAVATMLLLTLVAQLVAPNMALALTTGPSQPEVQGFEPVGTTDMVDMFSGSFVYNIPLIDVEGYPVNISYHGGVTMEQEASWVGLGWNINPGAINRTVRGVPDDFNGDTLFKDFNMKPEKTLRVGLGAGEELAGLGDPKPKHLFNGSLSEGGTLIMSNYRGVSADFTVGGNINVAGWVSAGVNLGVGSQTGVSIDYNAGLSYASSKNMTKDMAYGVGINVGNGYNTRSGLKDLNFSFSATEKLRDAKSGGEIIGSSASVPIGTKNYVPVITNSSTMQSFSGRVKLGGIFGPAYGYANINSMFSVLKYNNDASRDAYGYLYLQNASHTNTSILDFTRDKDGMFNKSMQFLPPPNMTYDIYSVSGQGTGGVFRPFRNDFGNVYDPYVTSSATSQGGDVEVGLGNLFEGGLDYTHTGTEMSSGPWIDYHRSGTLTKGFTGDTAGSVYEPVHFKQAGELTEVDSNYFSVINGTNTLTPDDFMALPKRKPNSGIKRDPRANLIYYHSAKDDTVAGVGSSPTIANYTAYNSDYNAPAHSNIRRIGTGHFQRKKDQISEIVQVQKDGRKYVYGIPAMNNVQREATFSVDPAGSNHVDLGSGLVSFASVDASKNNPNGVDHYYSSTVTPSYAHSYLLTSVLSSDYVDLSGNGASDDDLGSFTKFNYTRTDSDYRWVAPYSSAFNTAQYNPGYWSDPKDDKGSFVCGSREQWNLQAIETKNFIAEFYTSARHDALGIQAAILNTSATVGSIFNGYKAAPSLSYKLDSIKLYNKHDRFLHGRNAVPVKSVFFVYDYSLCPGILNSDNGGGKLTLKKIYFSYGSSQKSMISPYQFGYTGTSGNRPYNSSEKDRWGNYKPNPAAITNYEFPYVDQNDPANSTYAGAWSLSQITLPSGGSINTTYESNDYAFVQDKPVNEMFLVQGMGNSPAFVNDQLLCRNETTPYLYTYFNRRPGSELPNLSFTQNYLGRDFVIGNKNCMYFNYNVRLTGASNTFEQIKGYANVSEAGICPNDTTKGYVKFVSVSSSSGGNLHPVTYTALNTCRYSLSQIVYPGSDPNQSDLTSILSGLKGAFKGLLKIGKSPVLQLIKEDGGKNANLSKSFIRLQSVGLAKKGGGQRVKALSFSDNWQTLTGGTGGERSATYGKQYNYTVADNTYGTISSGVASYEPMVGGDENPFRKPVAYTGQSGSNFPPNDAVDLYQEMPIGESLFPSAMVGYSQVTVTSIHADQGKSSQGVDQYQFYTAKDFPAKVITTAINSNATNHYDFFSQSNTLTATQGYTLIFNDMHGKPKKIEHDVYNPASQTMQLISYQKFNYRQSGTGLDNRVLCLSYTGSGMKLGYKQLGIEEDVTLDCRDKNEQTTNTTTNGNLDVFYAFFPFAIAYAFTWGNESQNEFKSAAVTKVVQQYGILDNVQSYSEGAVTNMQNEIYDPTTGQPIVTSINNEFKDKEFTTNIPAYWVYKGMGPSYNNIGYKDTGRIIIDINHVGTLRISNNGPLAPGDELSIYYKDRFNVRYHTVTSVLGIIPTHLTYDTIAVYVGSFGSSTTWYRIGDTLYSTFIGSGLAGGLDLAVILLPASCNDLSILPRFPLNTPGWNAGDTLTSVSIEVVRSGQKNMLNENVESYTSMDYPVNSGTGLLNSSLTNLISLNGRTFADSNTMVLNKYIINADTVNPFAIGERGIWRLYTEYAYKADRNYAGLTSRNSGLFSATSMLAAPQMASTPCFLSPYNYFAPYFGDQNWHANRTVTKYSPYGKEIENIDAIGNYSTAVFGFNQELPVAVASNAKQGDIFTEGFEDYNILRYTGNVLDYKYSFFDNFFAVPLVGTPYYSLSVHDLHDSLNLVEHWVAHTGTHSVLIPITGGSATYSSLYIPVNQNTYTGATNHYNSYFAPGTHGTYNFSSGNEYLPFELCPGKSYIMSYWLLQATSTPNIYDYPLPAGCGISFMVGGSASLTGALVKKSNVIEGWQQVEATFTVPAAATAANLVLPAGFYMDDMRIYPATANMKSFVYNSTTEKLMATLDENNFATMYEYDQEGNLVRVKKETTKGIMTVSESRSGNQRH